MDLYEGMNRHNTAILVIDPVNSCADERCETPQWNIHFTKIREMLPRLNRFLIDWRIHIGGLVIIANITPWRREYLAENINILYTDPQAAYYSDDTSGFDERFFAVKPDKSDMIITKNTYNSFTVPKLQEILDKHRIKFIAACGVFTDGCVLASVVGGFSQGYNFVILRDLVETVDSAERQKLQELLLSFTFPKLYGQTLKSADFLKQIQNR